MNVFIDPVFSSYYQRYPLVLVDIGARFGLQSNWKSAQKYLRVVGFEPDRQEFARLVNSAGPQSIKYLNTALYNQKTHLELYLTREPGVSSVLKPNRAFLDRFPESEIFDILKTIPLEADTLDNQLQTHQIEDVDFVKVDTQGSELFILNGATATLDKCIFGLEVEVEFIQIYQNQPLFAEVDSFVRKFGFQLFDLKPYYWKRASGKNYGRPKGQIVFADALYLRDPAGLGHILDSIQDEGMKKSKILRALSICIIYGYLDYALEILEANSSLFTPEELRAFAKRLQTEISPASRIPDFRGRGRIAKMLLYGLHKVLKPFDAYHGWATSVKALGNLE